MLNHTVLIGRVATDLFLTESEGKTTRLWFKIAVDRPTKDDQADFFPVVAWDGQAQACKKVLQKGDLVAIDGSLRSHRRENEDGTFNDTVEVNARSVKFLRVKAWQTENGDTPAPAQAEAPVESAPAEVADDSDVPF